MADDDREIWAGARVRWREWAATTIGGSEERLTAATEAAIDVLRRGGSADVAAVAARQAAGADQPADGPLLTHQRVRDYVVMEELTSWAGLPEVPRTWTEAVAAAFARRVGVDDALLTGAYRGRPAAVAAVAMRSDQNLPGHAVGPVHLAPPRPSLREFLADRSVLLISYTGAFLLVVAAILFLLYGTAASEGAVRLAAVAAVNAVFVVASWACYRSARLRVVGRTYLAIAALLLPVTGAAAYVFLELGTAGVSRGLAVAATGAACAAIYAAIAIRLRSAAYGLLALLAVPIAWAGALDALALGSWWGVAFTPVVAFYAAVAIDADRSPRVAAAFARWAIWLQHAAVVPALLAPLALLPGGSSYLALSRREAVAAVVLAGIYWVASNLKRGRVSAAMTLLLTGLAWAFLVGSLDLANWSALALTPLVGLLLAVGAKAVPMPAADDLASVYEPFVYAATALVAVVALREPPAYSAAALGLLAVAFGVRRLRGGPRADAWFAVAALALAWGGMVRALDLGSWAPLAIAPLVAALATLQLPARIGRAALDVFATPAEWFGYAASAAMVAVAAPVAGWARVLTFAALAVVYISLAWMAARARWAAIGLTAAGAAWLAALYQLDLGGWTAAAAAPLVAAYAAAGHLSAGAGRRTEFGIPTEVLTHSAAAAALVAIPWGLLRPSGVVDWSSRTALYTSVTMAVLAISYALYCALSKRLWMSWAVGLAVSIAVLTGNQAAGLGISALAAELLVLAAAYAAFGAIVRSRIRTFFRAGAVVQAFAPAALVLPSAAATALILVLGSGVLLASALAARRAIWAYPAAVLFALAWFWVAKAVLPPPTHPKPSDLALVYSPLPVLYAVAGVLVGRRRARPWALPLYAVGSVVAVAVCAGAALAGDLSVAGWSLLAFAAAAYAAAAIEQFWPGGAVALAAAVAAVYLLMRAAAAETVWYPLAFAAIAVIVYAPVFAWQGRSRTWADVHADGAFAIGAASTLACFGVDRFLAAGRPMTLAAMLPPLVLAGITASESRRARRPLLGYGSIVVASLAGVWVARFAGATSAHWYTLAPGLAITAVGLRLPFDARVQVPQLWDRVLVGAGTATIMGTALIETFAAPDGAWLYTALLVVEGVVAVLTGIYMRSRVLVVAGSAGVAAAALRAVLLLVQVLPLYIVFGAVAILLLVAGAGIALFRDRFDEMRGRWTGSWHGWT